ncbi:MAG TPA: TonB-dependent receptor [Steroidobacteraceae bacterium]|jgi:vitamin B12 transporter
MRTPVLLSILVTAALLAPELSRAGADEAPDSVVVTATLIPTPEQDVASSISVITAEDIAIRQQQTLPDVLKNMPGLNLVQTGGPGGSTSLFMRGTNSNHTKVLVDGIDVTDPSSTGSTFDFGQFLTQDIERVEVLRGPQSGLYGADAIGGVINVITRSGQGPLEFHGSAEGGSFDTFNQAAGISGSDGQLHYSANVEHLHAAATPVTPLDLLLPGERRNDDYYDNVTGTTKLGLDVTDHFDLGLVARYTDSHLRFTGDDEFSFPSFPQPQQSASDTNEYYARVTAHSLTADEFLDQTLGVGYTRKRTTNFDPQSPTSLNTGDRVKVDWRGALKLSAEETLVLGAEHEHDEISEPVSAGVSISAGYAELQSRLGEHFSSALNVRYDANSQFGSKATYRVAPAWLIPESGTKLKASVGSGFKAPTLGELYQSFPQFFFFGNPDLKPETSIGYDVGFEQSLAANTVRFGATYFHNRIRNLIDTAPSGTTYANFGRATTQGVESFLSWSPVKSLLLRLDYTYTESTDDVLDQELLLRPRHKGTLDAQWQPMQALSFDLNVLALGTFIDGNRDFSNPRLQAPGYTVANIAANVALSPHLTLYARVDNLANRRYEIPVGFLQPSIGVFAGLKVRL